MSERSYRIIRKPNGRYRADVFVPATRLWGCTVLPGFWWNLFGPGESTGYQDIAQDKISQHKRKMNRPKVEEVVYYEGPENKDPLGDVRNVTPGFSADKLRDTDAPQSRTAP